MGELCVTCLVRVGRPRATVLRSVVCGPCWAAHGGSPDADEIGPPPTATVSSWDPRDQRHWLSALRRQDWVLDIRVDGQANLLSVAQLLAWSADWGTLESRPTWAHLVTHSGLSERTVARWLQELRVRGWLAHLEHGSTPAHRPTALAHLSGNRAALYGLRIPLTPAEVLHRAAEQLAEDLATQDPPAPTDTPSAPSAPDHPEPATTPPTSSSVSSPAVDNPPPVASGQHQLPTPGDRTGSPSWSSDFQKRSWFHGSTRASKTVDYLWKNLTDTSQHKDQTTALRADQEAKTGPDWAVTVPPSRFAMLVAADWLRHRFPLFASCSRKLVRHLCKPYWRAGWTNRDILHAMDHRPGLFGQPSGVLISPSRIIAPKAFIASRLAAWRTPDGAILPGYWTSRRTDAAATQAARRHIAAHHGHAGAALLRPGERALTAQRIAQHHHLLITRTSDGKPIPGPARLVHLDSA